MRYHRSSPHTAARRWMRGAALAGVAAGALSTAAGAAAGVLGGPHPGFPAPLSPDLPCDVDSAAVRQLTRAGNVPEAHGSTRWSQRGRSPSRRATRWTFPPARVPRATAQWKSSWRGSLFGKNASFGRTGGANYSWLLQMRARSAPVSGARAAPVRPGAGTRR